MASKKAPKSDGGGFFARFTVLAVVVLWAAVAAGNWAGYYLVEHNARFRVSNEEVRNVDDSRSRLRARPPVVQPAVQDAPAEDAVEPSAPEALATPSASPAPGAHLPGSPSAVPLEVPDALDPPGLDPTPTGGARARTPESRRDEEDPDARPEPLSPSPQARGGQDPGERRSPEVAAPARDERRRPATLPAAEERTAEPSPRPVPEVPATLDPKPTPQASRPPSRAGVQAESLPAARPTPRRENLAAPERPTRDALPKPVPTPERPAATRSAVRAAAPPVPTPAGPSTGDH